MATVRLDGVTKRYDTTIAVDDLSLAVADGEFVVLLGPSGCGKSTALRLIAGLERSDAGTISIDDRCVDDVDAKDRDVAMVFQSYALYPHMSVRRNIGFSLRPRGVPRRERDREAERVAVQLGLTETLDRKPRQLSGGQQQRVALARALVRRPAAFLMDEPLSNLDVQLRGEMRADLVRLQRELRATIVYVTHDQVEALTMADRIAVLRAGRLQQIGTPEAVYDRPANVFVAGFVGAPPMNLWPAAVDAAGRVTVAGVIVTDGAPAAVRGLDVTVGVRPESLRFAAHVDRCLAAVVEWVDDLGHEHIVGGTLHGGEAFALRRDGDGQPPALGSRVALTLDRGALHWFHVRTGERVT